MDVVGWITLAGVVLAALAALYTRRGNRIAASSLEIQRQQEQRQRPKLELYLHEGYFIRRAQPQTRVYVFHVRVTNQSDASNSLKEASLTIDYSQANQPSFKFNIQADASLFEALADRHLAPLLIPGTIEPHATLSGHLLFKIPETVLSSYHIDAYSVSITDAQGLSYDLRPIFVNEG